MSNARTSTRTTSRLARTAGAAATCVLLLAACSGGETSEDPSGTAQETEATGGGQAQVSIVDNAFEPTEIEVGSGSTASWENTGDNPHTVTFEDGEDSGTLESGATYSRTFDAAGDFPYACSIHPEMTGTVTVAE